MRTNRGERGDDSNRDVKPLERKRACDMADPKRLEMLRQTLAQLDGKASGAPRRLLPTGTAAIDQALGGGLALGVLHDLAPVRAADLAAATGFALALAARRQNFVLWIQQEIAAYEAGTLYGPGLDLFGLPMDRLLVLRVARLRDALWAMEEALLSGSVASVIVEVPKDGADLTATRRLSIAGEGSGTLALLLHHRSSSAPSAAATRWQIAAHPGPRDEFGGLGRTSFALSLVKNRHGPTGQWHVTWDHHEHAFTTAPSRRVAAAAFDRPDHALLARVG